MPTRPRRDPIGPVGGFVESVSTSLGSGGVTVSRGGGGRRFRGRLAVEGVEQDEQGVTVSRMDGEGHDPRLTQGGRFRMG